MLSKEAEVAIKSSTISILLISPLLYSYHHWEATSNVLLVTASLALVVGIILTVLQILYHTVEYHNQISKRAALLSVVFALGVFIRLGAPSNIQTFGSYMCVISMFHYTEFLVLALIDSKLVSVKSFVINHSPQYIIAATASWVEFFLESYYFPGLKEIHWLSNIGLVICICGELLRKIAMLQAGTNFNHLVQQFKADDHILVKSGVYKFFRHPSYVGWFYWSIGTQIILCNPVCVLGYTAASWCFFKERIYVEEYHLLDFFEQDYVDYQRDVGTGIPFVQGYIIR